MQAGQCFFMGVANIWSRLLKHNWWDLLYERIRTHSDVFSDFIFNENLSLYGYFSWSIVRRPNFSLCMRMISNHDLYFIVMDRFLSFWTAEDRSYRNHQMKLIIIGLSGPRENQNIIEKNEFYEWKIWRTIMKIMNENSFICIKINSWPQYDRTSSAFLSIIINFNSWFSEQGFRQHFFLSSVSYRPNFNSWFFRDQTGPSSAFISIIDSYRSIFSTAGSSRSNEGLASTPFYHRLIQVNLFNSWPLSIKWGLRQHPFLSSAHTGQILILFSWNNLPKTTLYEDFWWFSYRRIFPPIFLHELNFEFHFNSFYQWDE